MLSIVSSSKSNQRKFRAFDFKTRENITTILHGNSFAIKYVTDQANSKSLQYDVEGIESGEKTLMTTLIGKLRFKNLFLVITKKDCYMTETLRNLMFQSG